MQVFKETTYHCAACNKLRAKVINKLTHKEKILASPNGLVQYSDIHKCYDGMLGINNLHIDANFDIRSFSILELPEKKRKVSSVIGIPSPVSSNMKNVYYIENMFENEGYRLIILDQQLNVEINLGNVQPSLEEPEETIESTEQNVKLYYYKSNKKIMNYNRGWFKELVIALEELPPTKIGLFIETLRYIYDQHNSTPSEFDIQQLRAILSTHKIYITLVFQRGLGKRIRSIAGKYGMEKLEQLKDIIKDLKDQEKISIKSFINEYKIEIVYTIYMFIILENEGIIRIIREN